MFSSCDRKDIYKTLSEWIEDNNFHRPRKSGRIQVLEVPKYLQWNPSCGCPRIEKIGIRRDETFIHMACKQVIGMRLDGEFIHMHETGN